MSFKMVSCDGGGIRGYLTCRILQHLHEKTQFLDKADGFAGTSTGGLIAVALADGRTRGKDMGQLVDELIVLYRDDADRIFSENERSIFDKIVDEVLRWLKRGGGPGITASQFDASGLTEIGKSLVGERRLSSISPELVLAVNTVCLHRDDKVGWAPFTITNQSLPQEPWLDMSAVQLLDVALASAAAPSYFPPHLIQKDGVDLAISLTGVFLRTTRS